MRGTCVVRLSKLTVGSCLLWPLVLAGVMASTPGLAQTRDGAKNRSDFGATSSSDTLRIMRAGRPSTLQLSGDDAPNARNDAPHPLAADHPGHDVVVCIAGCTPGKPTVVSMRPRSAPTMPLTSPKTPAAKSMPTTQIDQPAAATVADSVLRVLNVQIAAGNPTRPPGSTFATTAGPAPEMTSPPPNVKPTEVTALPREIVCVAGCASPWNSARVPSSVASAASRPIAEEPYRALAMTPLTGKQIRQAFRLKIIDSGAATATTSTRLKARRTIKRPSRAL